jgi:TonB family protein
MISGNAAEIATQGAGDLAGIGADRRMSSDETVLGAGRAQDAAVAGNQRKQPIFWIALATAALVHLMFIVGIAVSHPRVVGDPKGNAGAIDVDIVDGSELKSSGTEAAAAPPPQPEQQAQPQQQPQEQPPEKEAEQQPEQKQAEAEPPPPEAKPEKEPEQAAAAPLALEPTPSDEPVLPESKEAAKPEKKPEEKKTPAKKTEPKPTEQKKASRPKTSALDLSVPWSAMQGSNSEGGDSSATRPPGITRSGENDRFGREVIRALKKTMPPSYGTRTRVTIRILLDPRGNVQQLELVQSGGKHDLDQDVVFAARQAVYPFPPKNATVADRTFLVTYVYR